MHNRGLERRRDRQSSKKKNVFEDIIVDNFDNFGKETDIQVQEAERALNKMNSMKYTPGHIIIKMSNIKKRILKKTRKKEPFA